MLSFGTLDTDGGFQAVTRTMKIVNIEPADHGYSLTLKDYNPALYEYGKLPEYKSNITYIPDGNPKPHTSDKGYVTREELKKVNEQAVKQAALEAAAKAAQAAIDVISSGDTFSDVFQLNGYGTSLENLIDKMDEDARNAKDGLSITKDEILLKVSDTEEGLQSYIGITKKEILAKADDMRRELTALLNVQAGAIHALVKGGGATGQMALTLNLLVMIDEATREKLIKASSLEKVNAVYAKVKDTDYYGIKGNAGDAIKLLWEDARRAALLASQISLEADQIQFKSDNIFVNGKLKADYINVLELAAKKTFVENLIVQKLHIDSDDTTHQDFEAWFDKTNGLKINNKGEEMLRVTPDGTLRLAKKIFFNFVQYKEIGRVLYTNSAGESCKDIFNRYGSISKTAYGYLGKDFVHKITIQKMADANVDYWCFVHLSFGRSSKGFWYKFSIPKDKYLITFFGKDKTYTYLQIRYPAYISYPPDGTRLDGFGGSLLYDNIAAEKFHSDKRIYKTSGEGYYQASVSYVGENVTPGEIFEYNKITEEKNPPAIVLYDDDPYKITSVMKFENIPEAKPSAPNIIWKDGDFLKIS